MKPPGWIPPRHLYRGVPAVRGWSQHQKTDREWTLCGIDLSMNPSRDQSHRPHCTEEETLVTCPYCKQLMHSGPINAARRAAR